MFSVSEKKEIAKKIEEILLGLNHPEMPDGKPRFKLHVLGKESWSWADIEPNWIFEDGKTISVNLFNEVSRNLYDQQKDGLL